ncbi:terminase large subunit domain-containing protein [Nocardioides zeae]
MVARKPGPKGPITAPPLDWSDAPERGWPRIVWFAETFLTVPKGQGAKQSFRLRDWQVDIVKAFFPTDAEVAAGTSQPMQGVLSLPRGNGKSGLAAVLAVYALLADEQEGAQVIVVASDERQAGVIYKAAVRMIETSDRLAEQVHIYADRVTVPHTDSELRTLPADEGALQGWAPTLALVDELHVVQQKHWDAVVGGLGKHERSLAMAISTPSDSTESVMWALRDYALEEKPEDFLYVEYAAPEGCELTDEDAWYEANPALGDFLKIEALRAQRRTMPEAAFRRYRLGQWVGSENTWLPWGVFRDLGEPRRVTKRDRVVLGFDGSSSGDSTVLVGCTVPKNGQTPYLFTVAMWESAGKSPGWRVPRDEVDAAVAKAFADYNVVELACDPWGWQSEVQAWAKRHGERRVVEFNTAHAARMAPATDRMYEAILESRIAHDGDPRLVQHFENAVAKVTHLGALIAKDRKSRDRKIDSAVASISALERATWHANKSARVGSFAA